MILSTVHSLFATPVYFSELNRELTKKELLKVDNLKKDSHKNVGNITSNNNYVLNLKEFKDIKNEIDLRIKDYFEKVICSSNNLKPYITQSWLNYTNKNEYHHKHAHPNSFVSGILYINCNKEYDKIKYFKSDDYQTLKPKVKEFNIYNSDNWWFSVKTGDIVLFPSSLVHMVEPKKGDNTRISLSFNIFIKGTIGTNDMLNELIIHG